MRILTAQQIRELDTFTIKNEPICSIDLMERASTVFVNTLLLHFPLASSFYIICGKGNNGGDGLAIARLLEQSGFLVRVIIIEHCEEGSADQRKNLERLTERGRINISRITNAENLPLPKPQDLVIDAILGSGLKRPLTNLLLNTVGVLNKWRNKVVSVDMPTGLFSESSAENDSKAIVSADLCITFHAPKLSLLFADNEKYVCNFEVVDIGLLLTGEDKSPWEYVVKEEVSQLFLKRKKFAHKGTFGHALLVSGSLGKMGAAIMCGRAILRSGVGLLTVRTPKCGLVPLQTALPEAMCWLDDGDNQLLSSFKPHQYSAIGVGPGIGTSEGSQHVLKMIIQDSLAPLVLDADALNILSENKTWLSFLPQNSIITPHIGEFDRLVGTSKTSEERLKKQIHLAIKTNTIVILKGAHSAIALPNGAVFFNSTGNPGMATAGSGDVLTGILTGLLSQGYHPKHAAIIGVFVHGLAGDIAAENLGQTSLLATDIIEYLPEAFKLVEV